MNKIWARAAWASLALFVSMPAMEANALPLMQWSDLISRPRPQASERIAYGADPNQFGHLWRPGGAGLHPLVVMIHGGCWEAATADLHIMDWAADDLRQRGYVVWNIEYRRIDQPGGGYPGTYEDVSTALAAVRGTGAARFGADLSRTVILGHSAGGHLALWAGHRAGARLKGVVAIGAITDLEGDTNTGCGVEGLPKMTGPQTADRPDVYADTSPYHMAAPVNPVVLITGAEDVTVPPAIARRYAARMAEKGATIPVLTPPGGHVEEIAPGSPAWDVVVAQIERLMKAR